MDRGLAYCILHFPKQVISSALQAVPVQRVARPLGQGDHTKRCLFPAEPTESEPPARQPYKFFRSNADSFEDWDAEIPVENAKAPSSEEVQTIAQAMLDADVDKELKHGLCIHGYSSAKRRLFNRHSFLSKNKNRWTKAMALFFSVFLLCFQRVN